MTNEQAINLISNNKKDYENAVTSEKKEQVRIRLEGFVEMYDMTIQALEKQIPRKPIEKHYEDEGEQPYIKYKCPSCDSKYQITKDYDEYCNKCGQKINWD